MRLCFRSLLFAALACAVIAPAAARAQSLSMDDFRALNRDVHDEKKAAAAVARLRAYLGDKPDSNFIPFARTAIVRGLIESEASSREISGAADSAESTLRNNPQVLFRFYADVAQALVLRNAELPRAVGYLHRAISQLPQGDPRMAPTRAVLRGTLGQAQLLRGHADSAVSSLEGALEEHPDSVQVLLGLGQAYDKSGKADQAIGAYVRALGCYPGQDTAAAAPLRTLWKKKHGSLAGMTERVAEARNRAKQSVAFDSRKYEKAAPVWSLIDLNGKPVKSSDFDGKVLVIDFWGSWCGPCREELPIFQRIYEKYRSKGVAFVGMNWEQPALPEVRLEKARDYVTKNKFTFPVVLDPERQACSGYGISGFPTVFMVDKSGMIRYRNVGVAPGIEQILTDQIESLLN